MRKLFGNKTTTPAFHYEQTTGYASLQVTIDENLFDLLAVEQNGIRLKITTKDKSKIAPSQLEFKGCPQTINGLEIHGVANFYARQTVKTNNLNLKISGVGDIHFDALECENLDCVLTGVGSITLSGEAQKASYKLTGVGDIKAYDLDAQTLDCTLTGVGDMQVYASEQLNANLSGVGDIRYKGNASVNSSASGMGKIKKSRLTEQPDSRNRKIHPRPPFKPGAILHEINRCIHVK